MDKKSSETRKTAAEMLAGLKATARPADQSQNQNQQTDETLRQLNRFFPSFGSVLADIPNTDEILASYVHDGDQWQEPAAVVSLYKETTKLATGESKRTFIRAMSAGDLSEVVGYAKSRKTAFCKMIARAALMGGDDIVQTDIQAAKVLYIDTEQSDLHAQRSYNDITKGLPDEQRGRLQYVKLRRYSQNERLYIIYKLISELRPTLAVIDGVADILPDTNSNTDAPVVVNMLMALASETQAHIFSVLHTSAANASKGRGHIGSEFERKAETVFLVEKEKGTNASTIKPQYTRNGDFKTLRIEHTDDGLRLTCEETSDAPSDETLTAKVFELMEAANPAQKQFNTATFKEYIKAAWRALGGGDLGERDCNKIPPRLLAAKLVVVETRGNQKLYSRTPLQRREAGEIDDKTQTMDFDTTEGKEAENGR